MFKSIVNWNIEEMTGYKPITTYYTDFGIAERFGVKAITDTYNKAIKYTTDYKKLTEIVMVLNWKIWEHHDNGNDKLAMLYDAIWKVAVEYTTQKLSGEELEYYYRMVD